MESSNQALQQRKVAATVRGVGVMTQIFVDHAKNAEFWDIEGRRFIDFAGGIAVLNTGHCHPKIQAAIAAQLAAKNKGLRHQIHPRTAGFCIG